MSNGTRINDESLRNMIIEGVESVDEDMHVASREDWEPTVEFILTACKLYRRNMNHNKKNHQRNNSMLKNLKALPPERQEEIKRQLGLID